MLRTACTLAVLLGAASAASAQTNVAPTAPAKETTGAMRHNRADLQQRVAANLKQSGFTDVKIAPDSFLVQAKDKEGNPVTMWINPESFTEVVALGDEKTQNSGSAAGAFENVTPNTQLSSKIVGTDVYNNDDKDIGVIKDVAFSANGVKAYILDVGGFLGIGGHYVAVRPSSIRLSYDDSAKKWNAKMDATADQLKAAPDHTSG